MNKTPESLGGNQIVEHVRKGDIMKRLKGCVGALTAVLFLMVSSNPALADGRQRHVWEGIAIGLGAAVVASAVLNPPDYSCYRSVTVNYAQPVVCYSRPCVPVAPRVVYRRPPVVYVEPSVIYVTPGKAHGWGHNKPWRRHHRDGGCAW